MIMFAQGQLSSVCRDQCLFSATAALWAWRLLQTQVVVNACHWIAQCMREPCMYMQHKSCSIDCTSCCCSEAARDGAQCVAKLFAEDCWHQLGNFRQQCEQIHPDGAYLKKLLCIGF